MIKLNKSSTLFEAIDNDMRNAILQLNQKLINLQTEISTKLTALKDSKEVQHLTQSEQLSLLENEIERALTSLKEVFDMAISTELNQSEFLTFHRKDLDKFREMVASNVEKMSKINEKL